MFNESVAHRILAGSDMLLVPSRYEPCGLTQLYALRYGTVPVVRRTGGLRDTVKEFAPGRLSGNGFLFNRFDANELVGAVKRSLAYFGNAPYWHKLQQNGMQTDFSWRRPAEKYLQTYTAMAC